MSEDSRPKDAIAKFTLLEDGELIRSQNVNEGIMLPETWKGATVFAKKAREAGAHEAKGEESEPQADVQEAATGVAMLAMMVGSGLA